MASLQFRRQLQSLEKAISIKVNFYVYITTFLFVFPEKESSETDGQRVVSCFEDKRRLAIFQPYCDLTAGDN